MARIFSNIELTAMLASLLLAGSVMLNGSTHAFAVPLLSVTSLIMVLWIAGHDFRDFTIPDGPLICLALIAISGRLVGRADTLDGAFLSLLIDILACGGALWLIRETYFRLRGYDGLGFGDVKLAAVGGILVGYAGMAWSVFLASMIGLLCVLAFKIVLPKQPLDKLPFGALLAPAFWLVWIFGPGFLP